MKGMFRALADFFMALKEKKAHWYRVYDPDDEEISSTIIKATFPSLATLMLMDNYYIISLFLQLGLVKKRVDKRHTKGYILFTHATWLGITS